MLLNWAIQVKSDGPIFYRAHGLRPIPFSLLRLSSTLSMANTRSITIYSLSLSLTHTHKQRKMLSMSVQPSIKGTLPCPFSIVSKKPCFPISNSSVSLKQKPLSLPPLSNPDLKTKPVIRRFQNLSAAATAELATPETTAEPEALDSKPAEEPKKVLQEKQKIPKPRLVLKFIWMEKNIGLGLDKLILRCGTAPVSPYYFWPRKDAWEELKIVLESKPWVSQKKMIILLNQATDIINLWQQSGGNLT